MFVKKSIFFMWGSLLFLSGAWAEGTSWVPSLSPSVLNPKMSVIADFVGQSGSGGDPSQTQDGFHLREVEIGLQAEVDPYARADFYIGGLDDQGSSPELEEGYITLPALPFRFQLRGGKFKAYFGRLNMVHSHEGPQVDAPLALSAFLGEEGLVSTGLELSRVFAPLGLYTEATYALLQDLGDTVPGGSATTQVVDVNGSTVTVDVPMEETAPAQRLRNFAHVAKVRFYKDINDASNVDLGVSGALHEPKDVDGSVPQDFDRKRFTAVDLTFRWKPLARGVYRSAIWRTEGFYTDRSLAPVTDPVDASKNEPAARINRRGGYSYVEFQPRKRWRAGVRGDYVEDPAVRDNNTPHITRAVAPYVTFTLSEFNRFRVQWTRKDLPGNETENLGYMQWTVVLGPHGAHSF